MALRRVSPWGRNQYLIEDLHQGPVATGGFIGTTICFLIIIWYLGYRIGLSGDWEVQSKLIIFGTLSAIIAGGVIAKNPNFPAFQWIMVMMLIFGVSWFPGIASVIYKDAKFMGMNDGYVAPIPNNIKQPLYVDFKDGKGPIMTYDGEKYVGPK